jgi:hypothetical protein
MDVSRSVGLTLSQPQQFADWPIGRHG